MFYRVSQNNSGGYYIKESVEAGVGKVIVIEAECSEQARERFEQVRENYGGGFDSYCECCGRRWWSSFYDEDATDTPDNEKGSFVHYLDGRIVRGEDVVVERDADEDYY